MAPRANLLPCGTRLHLQHGPIDLIIGADGDRQAAFQAAQARFSTILTELVTELPALKRPMSDDVPLPQGAVAVRMDQAARPFAVDRFVTRMAAVAGSVADAVLEAMTAVPLTRAYVNNGGDIALHLTKGQSFTLAMAGHDGGGLGRVQIGFDDPTRGIATSGRHGRSQSLGIADSVTVLAETAARADVAATLIANAVDLPKHPSVIRKPASAMDEASDLGELPVVVGCGALPQGDIAKALSQGAALAETYVAQNRIAGAALFLQGQSQMISPTHFKLSQRTPHYA